jgi:hypothetical protein
MNLPHCEGVSYENEIRSKVDPIVKTIFRPQ